MNTWLLWSQTDFTTGNFNALHRSKVSQSTLIISHIVGFSEVCDQNGDWVYLPKLVIRTVMKDFSGSLICSVNFSKFGKV